MNSKRLEELRGVLWRESLKYEPLGIDVPEPIRAGLELVREVDELKHQLSVATEEAVRYSPDNIDENSYQS